MNTNTCKCGMPWEEPCKCPENILERFSIGLPNQIFYYETLGRWVIELYGEADAVGIINDVLNVEGVIEIGDSAYKTPYEI